MHAFKYKTLLRMRGMSGLRYSYENEMNAFN